MRWHPFLNHWMGGETHHCKRCLSINWDCLKREYMTGYTFLLVIGFVKRKANGLSQLWTELSGIYFFRNVVSMLYPGQNGLLSSARAAYKSIWREDISGMSWCHVCIELDLGLVFIHPYLNQIWLNDWILSVWRLYSCCKNQNSEYRSYAHGYFWAASMLMLELSQYISLPS